MPFTIFAGDGPQNKQVNPMNKDMENTFNQMAELGGSDERLGTNTTPIINAPLLPMNTRPAAPVEGLGERATGLREGNTSADILAHKLKEAEAIIAAKDAEISRLRNILDITERNELREAENNAALTARVNELELIRDSHSRDTLQALREKQALETQLATAKEAHKSLFGDKTMEGILWPDVKPTGLITIRVQKQIYDKARAALEDRP